MGMLRWTDEQLAEYHGRKALAVVALPTPKGSKYRNVRTEQAGEKYDSKAEAARHDELKRMERAGLISNLRRQVPFELAPGVKIAGACKKSPALRYFADFVYERDGAEVIEDVKGGDEVTESYRIKRHLMAVKGYSIVEIRKGKSK